MALVSIGFGSFISAERLVGVLSPESAPIKRMIQDARERGSLIDASYGRKTKSVLVTDGGYLILSALTAETVAERLDIKYRRGILWMSSLEKGKLLVISGPSGAGKSTVIGKLMEKRDDVCFSVSVTTRPMRPGEVDGKDYFFVSPQHFQELAEGGYLLEYAEYVGNRYGTPRGYVEQRQLEGKSVILDIEVQGASQIVRNCPDAVTVFILPPSGEELERRLRHRNTDSDEKIRERLLQAKRECAEAGKYGYIVVNDDPDAAAGEVDAILTAEKCRAADRINLVTEVLIS